MRRTVHRISLLLLLVFPSLTDFLGLLIQSRSKHESKL